MANLQLYTLAYVLVTGNLLTEEGEVTVKRSTGSKPVDTTAKGYAGESPGAAMVEIDVSNAVPAAGFEYNAQTDMAALNVVEIGVQAGGQLLVAKGFIIEDTFKHSTGAESKYDFKFRGQFAPWQ